MSDETDKPAETIAKGLLDTWLDYAMRDPYYRALRRQRQQRALRDKLRVIESEKLA